MKGKKSRRKPKEDKVLTIPVKHLLPEDILLLGEKELRVREVDKGAKGTRFPHITAVVSPIAGFAVNTLHMGQPNAKTTIRRPAL